jgi:hypothetical protein
MSREGRAVLPVATDCPSTDWVVRLCDVGPAGVSRNIVDEVVRSEALADQLTQQEIDLSSTTTSSERDTASGYTSPPATFRAGRARNLNTGSSTDDRTQIERPNSRLRTTRRGHRASSCPSSPAELHSSSLYSGISRPSAPSALRGGPRIGYRSSRVVAQLDLAPIYQVPHPLITALPLGEVAGEAVIAILRVPIAARLPASRTVEQFDLGPRK